MKIKKIILCVLLTISGTTFANEQIDAPSVAVNANPLIESIDVDEYSTSSSVVSDKQIKDLNSVDIASALRTTPGVQISRFNPVGGYGGDQGGAVYIHGMGASRPGSEIKTYIDGIPFYSGVWNHPLVDLLPVNGMSSITVYKSPQLQVNGNNFASINLMTKTPTEDGIHGDTRMSAGSFGTVTEQAALYGKQDAIDFMFAQGYAKSNGHRANADGELKNAMGKVGLQIDDHWRTDLSFLYVDNYAKDPNPFFLTANGAPKYSTQAGMLIGSLSHKYQNLSGEFKVYGNQGEAIWTNPPAYTGYGGATKNFKFDMNGLRIKEEASLWSGGLVTVGLDLDNIMGKVDSTELARMQITSPYIVAKHTFKLTDDWSVIPSLGARYYDHNIFDSKTAYQAGVSLVSEKATLYANTSRGINYPGQEGAALATQSGLGSAWRNLTANDMEHYEIGAKLNPLQGTNIDVNLFHDQVNNRFVYQIYGPINAYSTGPYHTNGLEASIKQHLTENWLGFANYTWLDPNVNNLPYMPKSSFMAGLNGKVGDFKVAIDAQYQSKIWANTQSRVIEWGVTNNQQVDSFAVVNIRTSYPVPQLGKKGEVFVAVENLFDEKYEYSPGYTMPGINGQVGFVANF